MEPGPASADAIFGLETGPPLSANGDGSARDFAPLRERARQDGIAIEVEPVADGTRLAWSVSLHP
jgi:hypothetical protein